MNKNAQNNAQNAQDNTQNAHVIATQRTGAILPEEYNNLESISGGIEYLNIVQTNLDYTKSVLYNALSKLPETVFKALNVSYDVTTKKKDGTYETKSVFVDNYVKYCAYKWNDSQSYVSKMVRVAERFLSAGENLIEKVETEHDGKKLEIIKTNNTETTVIRKDKYGFKFSLSALAEMLRFTDEQLKTAIDEEDLIDSSTPSAKVRTILENRFKKTIETTATENADGNTDSNTDSNTDGNTDTDTYTVENTDISRLTAIQTILNSLSDEYKNNHAEQLATITKIISLGINELAK